MDERYEVLHFTDRSAVSVTGWYVWDNDWQQSLSFDGPHKTQAEAEAWMKKIVG